MEERGWSLETQDDNYMIMTLNGYYNCKTMFRHLKLNNSLFTLGHSAKNAFNFCHKTETSNLSFVTETRHILGHLSNVYQV